MVQLNCCAILIAGSRYAALSFLQQYRALEQRVSKSNLQEVFFGAVGPTLTCV